MSDLLKGVNLYLIGMMGVGKTTIGQRIAQQLSYQFFDTDALVERVSQRSVADIFAAEGEPAFRQLETQILSEISTYTHLVIATGGGIVLNPLNWSYLRHGIVVWLDAPVSLLVDRLQADTSRPLLQTADPAQRLQTLLNDRRPLYAQADVRVAITAADTPAVLSDRVLTAISQVLRSENKVDE